MHVILTLVMTLLKAECHEIVNHFTFMINSNKNINNATISEFSGPLHDAIASAIKYKTNLSPSSSRFKMYRKIMNIILTQNDISKRKILIISIQNIINCIVE